MSSTDTISLTEAYAHLGEHARRVMYTRRPVRISRARQPLVKIVPDDAHVVPDDLAPEYEAWLRQREPMAA